MSNHQRGSGRGRRGGAVLAGLLALAACGDRPAAEAARDDGREPRRGGTAVVAEAADMEKPMPLVWTSGLDSDLMDMLYLSLTRGDWREGRLDFLVSDESPMALAWRWEYTGPDSLAIRYRMRSGLRWSDGQPITAHDVVWTYEMTGNPEVASPRQDHLQQMDSVRAENDSTVVFYFKRRYPDMLFDSGLSIAPRHAYAGTAPAGLRTHPVFGRPQEMVVSGPWKIGEWRPGQQITLVPNPHSRVRPRLDRLVIRIIPETTTRLVELQNGTVDFARGVPFDQVPGLRQRAPGLEFEREEKRFWEYIAYNPRTVPQFADPDIRRALGMAIDVPGLMQALQMGDFAVQASGPYPPIFRELYDPEGTPPLPFDTAQAKQILEQKGWRDADGDGIRERNGRPFRFTLITNTGNQRRADLSQILQRQWRAVGVDVRLQTLEFATVQQRTIAEKTYEASLGSWGVQLSPDLRTLWAEDAPFNIVSWRNPQAWALIERAAGQPTDEAANPLWRQAAARIVQDHPYTWLYYYDSVTGRSERLRGVVVDPYGAYQNTWEWWVTDGAAPPAASGGDSARDTRRDTAR